MKRKMIFGVAVFVALGGSGASWIVAQDSDPPGLSCASGELRQTDFLHWSSDFDGYPTAREAVEDQTRQLLRLQLDDRTAPSPSGPGWEVRRGERLVATIILAELPGGRYLVEEVTTCSGDAASR